MFTPHSEEAHVTVPRKSVHLYDSVLQSIRLFRLTSSCETAGPYLGKVTLRIGGLRSDRLRSRVSVVPPGAPAVWFKCTLLFLHVCARVCGAGSRHVSRVQDPAALRRVLL
jgi:hypothetical protein